MESFRELLVWQAGIKLVREIYLVSVGFPADERFGLTSQIRRAAVSIPSNIAEGWGRGSTKDYLRFLSVAQGSLREVETQLVIAQELGFCSSESVIKLEETVSQISRMLLGLRRSLEKRLSSPHSAPQIPNP